MSPLEMPLMGYAPLTTPPDDNGSQMANRNFHLTHPFNLNMHLTPQLIASHLYY